MAVFIKSIQATIQQCVENVVSKIRKQVELDFNKNNHHKSGRSGCHGKKFNIISQTIIRSKNDNSFLVETGCFKDDKEKKIVIQELIKHSNIFFEKAKSINHK